MYSEILSSVEVGSKDSKASKDKNTQRAADMRGLSVYLETFISFILFSNILVPSLCFVMACVCNWLICSCRGSNFKTPLLAGRCMFCAISQFNETVIGTQGIALTSDFTGFVTVFLLEISAVDLINAYVSQVVLYYEAVKDIATRRCIMIAARAKLINDVCYLFSFS